MSEVNPFPTANDTNTLDIPTYSQCDPCNMSLRRMWGRVAHSFSAGKISARAVIGTSSAFSMKPPCSFLQARLSSVFLQPRLRGWLGQDFGNGPHLEPPLFFGPLMDEVGHAGEIF